MLRSTLDKVIRNPILFISALCAALTSCGSAELSESGMSEPDSIMPFVYTRYLHFAEPAAGIEAEFNPPVLRWPRVEGDSILYDVRLSQDSSFVNRHHGVSGTPWAMFNPHDKLATGVWYWQHRTSGDAWSPMKHFLIDEQAVEVVSPPAARFLNAIPGDHPRILARSSAIPTLTKLTHDPDAAAIIRTATAYLAMSVPLEQDGHPKQQSENEDQNKKYRQDASSSLGKRVYTMVSALCQAWILTGDDRYKSHATAIGLTVGTWDPTGITGSKTNDFADARCMLSMALVFDTFYAHLTKSERSILQKAIRDRASRFYRSWINNQEARLLSGHVWQHILHYFFETSLALYGHEPDASTWLAYAYELFLARAPILGGKEGGWAEGASYFRMNMETLINIPLYIKECTGFDFINAHPWYSNNIAWLVYHVPPGSSSDGFGDNAEEVFSPGVEYRAFAAEVAKLTGNKLASWYVQECARHEPLDLSGSDMLRWVRLTKTKDLPMPDPGQKPVLPLGKLFPELGLASLHSDPAEPRKGLAVALRSSPFGSYGHFLSDQNAFNILYAGKRTFFRTGYKVTMTDPHRTGWYQHTKSNNSVLIDGNGQPYSTEAFGWIRKLVAGESIAYTLGDASNAYSSRESEEDYGVKRFYRHVVLLKPDVVVVYDELEASRDVQWSWLIHSLAKINLEENAFSSLFEHASAVGKVWSSEPLNFSLADTFDVPAVNWRGSRDATGKRKTYNDEQWHLKAETSKTRACRFLAVMRISPAADVESIIDVWTEGTAEIKVGDWEIFCSLGTDEEAALHIKRSDDRAAFKYTEGAVPFIAEDQGEGQRVLTARDVVPWQLKQSMLNHGKIN